MATRILEPAASAYSYPLLIKRLLQSPERFEPGNEIVYRDRVRYDYRTLQQRVCRLANLLKTAGVDEGDTVAVLDWDSHRYLECYFAVPMIGAVLHHVNVRLAPEQIAYSLDHAEDRLVLVHEDFVPLIEALRPRLHKVRGYILLRDDPSDSRCDLPLVGDYEQLMSAADPAFDFPDFDENSIATTFYTTGTTGTPKGVCFSHRQLVLHTLNMLGFLGAYDSSPLLRSDDVYMPITPMFHVHAWGVPYVATLLGVKQVYPGRYDPRMLVELQQTENVTFSHCVPTILQMLLGCDAAGSADFSGWKMVIGGSALPRGLASRALERGIDVYAGYGLSETCPLLSVSHLSRKQRAQPVEAQLDGRTRTTITNMVDLRLVDLDGQPQPADGLSVGEVVVRAPWLTQGYLKDPRQSGDLWAGGWLHTGDIGCLYPDGTLEIRDRIRDMIKSGGEWVSSLALEDLIGQHPDVAAVAVVARPDPDWGECPHALVVARPDDDQLDAEAIRSHLQQYVDAGRISSWWVPREIELVDDIPRTSVGKIDKKAIRHRLAQS